MMGAMRNDGEEVPNSTGLTTGVTTGVTADGWSTGWLATLRGILDRPLASYYLLRAGVGLLVFIGLVMVFSVTSIDNYATTGSPFTSIVKQVLSAVVGLVAFWVCQRLPVRTFRAVAVPLLASAFGLMVFVDLMGWVASSRTPPGDEVQAV